MLPSKQRVLRDPHHITVPRKVIPTHRLPSSARFPTRVERIRPTKSWVNNGVHRHDFHELFFFAKGTGRHMIDLGTRSIEAPSLHLVAPGQVHQLVRSEDMEGTVVMFGPDARLGQGHSARAALFAHTNSDRSLPLDKRQLAEANTLVELMEEELARAEGPVLEVVEGYLGILLIKCAHWTGQADERQASPRDMNDPVRRFQDLVERGFLEQRQVAHYSRELSLSPDRLNVLVRERLGRTAGSVIHDRLLLEARRLLLHSEMSVKEVGYALNLKDPAYFTRWFRKASGMTPAAYRAHVREKYQH